MTKNLSLSHHKNVLHRFTLKIAERPTLFRSSSLKTRGTQGSTFPQVARHPTEGGTSMAGLQTAT
jgi:hypothetical protein